MANLSGEGWWRRNQGNYPNSKELTDLDPAFGTRVEKFVASVRHAGATVTIGSTRRDPTRAFLMHYSWKVAYGDLLPNQVPRRPGLQIEWDHGDLKASRAGATEMVNLFHMAHIAALRSNHIRGMAVDMTIGWKGELVLTRPRPLHKVIATLPRNGQNRELQEIGGNVFGVHKLKTDPPHWSINGR